MKTTQPQERKPAKAPIPSRTVSRRCFLGSTMGLAAGLTVAGTLPATSLAFRREKQLPNPIHSGIEHIIVVTMENRSFDHFLGWLPGAEGVQAGLSYRDSSGALFSTYPLAPDYQGCGHPDPDHSYSGGHIEYNHGQCDGWLRAGSNDIYAIGYYGPADLAFLAPAVQTWTTCDNYFAPILAGTYPNRMYLHAAQTDRLDDSIFPFSRLPTIWDRLAAHSVSHRYYYSDVPFLALWGTKYLGISSPIAEFFAACASGALPNVCFVDPRFQGETEGLTNDDHPHADIRNGEDFLNTIYEAVASSPAWRSTVLVINFDEWGGFFDHVAPQRAPVPPGDAALGSDGLRGFRVPALVISPWSPRRTIIHDLYDHTSVLKMIEWRWHLGPLTIRDAAANNLADVLDFTRFDPRAPAFNVPAGPFGAPCPTITPAAARAQTLGATAASLGFPVQAP